MASRINFQQVMHCKYRATSMIIRYVSGGRVYRGLRDPYRFPLRLRSNPYTPNGSWTAAAPRHSMARSFHATTVTGREIPGMWMMRKVGNYINNDPLTKISLIFGGGLLAFLLLLEYLTSLRKSKPVSTVIRPPKAMHFVIKLTDQTDTVDRAIKALHHQSGLPVLFLTGPPGVGKTHLAHQYTEKFTSRGTMHVWLSGKPVVLYVDGSNEEQMLLTLREAAFSLGVKLERRPDNSATCVETWKDSCLVVAKALNSTLSSSKVPWLMVVDNLGDGCSGMLDSLQEGLEGTKKGAVLVTAVSFFPGKQPNRKDLKIKE